MEKTESYQSRLQSKRSIKLTDLYLNWNTAEILAQIGIYTVGDLIDSDLMEILAFLKSKNPFAPYSIRRNLYEIGVLFKDEERYLELQGIRADEAFIPVAESKILTSDLLPSQMIDKLKNHCLGTIETMGQLFWHPFKEWTSIFDITDEEKFLLQNAVHNLGYKFKEEIILPPHNATELPLDTPKTEGELNKENEELKARIKQKEFLLQTLTKLAEENARLKFTDSELDAKLAEVIQKIKNQK